MATDNKREYHSQVFITERMRELTIKQYIKDRNRRHPLSLRFARVYQDSPKLGPVYVWSVTVPLTSCLLQY